jgi:glycosyltransferase involved in cell wall biosynthesis
MNTNGKRSKVLIFIVAYNAERTIQNVVRRIPASLLEHDTEILVIDDSSRDRTFEVACKSASDEGLRFPLTVLTNPVNQGYGGNQKVGLLYAIRKEFDIVALLHGDGQYAPELLPELLIPLVFGEADAVFGSRMMNRLGALKGRMPLYKYIGNRILTRIQNFLLRSRLTEFHSGYRLYSVAALRRIPFERNTHDFHFDTEITIQLLRAGLRIKELPIPTYYGDEISYVNVLRYGIDVLRSSFLARAQDFGIFYERKFDLSPAPARISLYQAKLGFESPHTLALARVTPGSAVLDVGCASGYLSRALRLKHCSVTGIDQVPPPSDAMLDKFIRHDLDEGMFPVNVGTFDYVLLLDVIEHLRSPEAFMDLLRNSREEGKKDTQLIVSTGNVAFFITRFMLLFGFFNYGARGILDLTHRRLFTFSTFRKLFEQAGYHIEEVRGVPAPFPLALRNAQLAQVLLALNKMLIRISRPVFSYQIFMVVRPLPSVAWFLEKAIETTQERALADSALAPLSRGERGS